MTECFKSLQIAKLSNCPSSKWQHAIHDTLQRNHMSYLNIGANVGSNVNEFLNMFNMTWNISPRLWHEQTKTGCGNCQACESIVKKHTSNSRSPQEIHIVAVEMMTSTFLRLKDAFRAFDVPGVVLHAAGGEVLKTVFEPEIPHVGYEAAGIVNEGTPIPMITVDAITKMLPSSFTNIYDILSIDTEGNDALVLQGAQLGIQRHAFRVIEFEYHGLGHWVTASLNTTMSMLKKNNYSCYWQGNNGALSRYNTMCSYEFKKWSNLVCAHEQNILNIFDTLT